LSLLVDYIYSVTQLTPNHCDIWIHEIARKGNLSPSSVNRIIGSCKNFYKYLQEVRVFPEDETMPFKVPMAYRRSKKKHSKAKKESWKPYSKKELEHIYLAAQAMADTDLVDLIYLAAHSGARIEELCSLEIELIDLENRCFEIEDSKTEAGYRIVPIHSAAIHLITRLIEKSKNSYLFGELTKNKYDDRSNAIGKRFGRLKKKLGYGRLHVFHSIRKTFSTELERGGITENISADIVGHEKQTITYGLYSGGTSLEQKREAVEKVRYLFTEYA
jgi:integrase